MTQHEHTKAVLNRLSRAIGHLGAIKKMVEDGRDCSEILIQLSAVKSQIVGTSKVVLKDHLEHCVKTPSKSATMTRFVNCKRRSIVCYERNVFEKGNFPCRPCRCALRNQFPPFKTPARLHALHSYGGIFVYRRRCGDVFYRIDTEGTQTA